MGKKQSICKVWYYLQFQTSTGDLGTYPVGVRRTTVLSDGMVLKAWFWDQENRWEFVSIANIEAPAQTYRIRNWELCPAIVFNKPSR